MSKLHFMAIDNFMISNQCLQKLVLINVGLTNEMFEVFSDTISASVSLRSINLSQNQLKDSGAL